jgi:phosphatidylglycerophosphate synthase
LDTIGEVDAGMLGGHLIEAAMSSHPVSSLHTGEAALRRDTATALAAACLGLALLAWTLGQLAGFGAWYVPKALLGLALTAACIWRGLATHAPHQRFGAANAVTLTRLALVALLAAAASEPLNGQAGLAWLLLGLATLAAVLDMVDGPLARRSGQASAFGARFDMETDALLVLVLSLLVWHLGKAGAWVLAAGAMRYAFVLAACVWPWLGAALPASWRRKAVCVALITALIVCLGPIIPVTASQAIAASGLALLAWSFARDLVWLARQRSTLPETAP